MWNHVPAKKKTANKKDMTSSLPVCTAWLNCHVQVNGVNHRAERSEQTSERWKIYTAQFTDGERDVSKWGRWIEAERRIVLAHQKTQDDRERWEKEGQCEHGIMVKKHQSLPLSHFPSFLLPLFFTSIQENWRSHSRKDGGRLWRRSDCYGTPATVAVVTVGEAAMMV